MAKRIKVQFKIEWTEGNEALSQEFTNVEEALNMFIKLWENNDPFLSYKCESERVNEIFEMGREDGFDGKDDKAYTGQHKDVYMMGYMLESLSPANA